MDFLVKKFKIKIGCVVIELSFGLCIVLLAVDNLY